MHFFPDPSEPTLQPFALAFVRLMFAHAGFERRVSELMGVIADDGRFGEKNRWLARQRPKLMKKLIDKHHPEGLPEMNGIVDCLKRSITPCDDRNLLAHGTWWKFDTRAGSITIRSATNRPDEEQHRDRTITDIELIAATFDELEVELYKMQRTIEKRTASA